MTRYTVSPPMQKPFPPSGKIKVTPEEREVVINRLFKEGYKFMFDKQKTLYIVWIDRGNGNKFMNYFNGSEFKENGNPEYTMTLFAPVEVVDDDVMKEVEAKAKSYDNIYVDAFFTHLKSNYKLTKL